MKRYKMRVDGWVIDTDTNTHIPPDVGNGEYADFLAWEAEGNTPDPADPIPEPSLEDRRRAAYRVAYSVDEVIEALLEKESGRAEKMAELLQKRSQVRAEVK